MENKKLIVISPVYATTTKGDGATPVVHYFAKEWVKQGYDVTVFHFAPRYPTCYYWFASKFQHKLNSLLGMLVPTTRSVEGDYVADGVVVHKRLIKKVIPHSNYSRSQIRKALMYIADDCSKNGLPIVFIGHWDNPQLEVLSALKDRYGTKTCLVFHNNVFHLEKLYGNKIKELLGKIDVVGFRNASARQDFERKYGIVNNSFIACSGVSEDFILAGEAQSRSFEKPVSRFVYTGSLIQRKHPVEVLTALAKAYPDGNFEITYIGDGAEKENIEAEYHRLECPGHIVFTGRIPREEVIRYLKEADAFLMISKGEIFGLVYLEAMALGLIPVGSRNEGIDGIIVDGENGFLCEAGNVEELVSILKRIRLMSTVELMRISENAKKTANEFSDARVSENYLESLFNAF